MSTAPLTLPTVEELKAEFPQARALSTVWGDERLFDVGTLRAEMRTNDGTDWFRVRIFLPKRKNCIARVQRRKDWKQCVEVALVEARAQLVKEAEEAQAAVAALDEALKEVPCPSSK